MTKENEKKPKVDVNDKVLWTGADLETYGAKILKLHDTVDGKLADLEVYVLSPFSGVENTYHQYKSPYNPRPERNSWRTMPGKE
jgi:hypothetical protein